MINRNNIFTSHSSQVYEVSPDVLNQFAHQMPDADISPEIPLAEGTTFTPDLQQLPFKQRRVIIAGHIGTEVIGTITMRLDASENDADISSIAKTDRVAVTFMRRSFLERLLDRDVSVQVRKAAVDSDETPKLIQ